MTTQPYKGYFIEGDSLLVHPFNPDWYVGGDVCVAGPYSSIVGVTRFQLQQLTVSIKGLAEWFGLEVARIVGGRMPAAARELNGTISLTLLPHGPLTASGSPEFTASNARKAGGEEWTDIRCSDAADPTTNFSTGE